MTLYQLFDTNDPLQVVSAGDGPQLIVNRDEQFQLLISDNASIEPDWFPARAGNFSVIDPLGSAAVTGDSDIFVVPTGSPVLIDVIPTGTYWAASPVQIAAQIAPLSAAIAQQIAATGIPIIPSPVVIYNL
jgi:hypothetical protein